MLYRVWSAPHVATALARRLAPAVMVGSLLAVSAPTSASAAACNEPDDTRIWWSPEEPVAGEPLRLLAVSEEAGEAVLVRVTGSNAQRLATVQRGGPPWSFAAELAEAPAGTARFELRRGNKVIACRTVAVKKSAKERKRRVPEGVAWKTTRRWDRTTENLFSAWVEGLFDAPVSESLSFRPLTPALRDARRNFLQNHLSMREDDPKNKDALPAEPDCADLPYFLRAYFAWKLGLPVGFRDCNRGSSSAPPRCGDLTTNEAPAEGKTALRVVRQFMRKLANTVHSGSARIGLADEAGDVYPVSLLF